MKYNLNFRAIPYLTLLYLFFFLYASTAQTAEPICTHDSSNDAVCCKEVLFRGRVDTKLHLGEKNPPKTPNFGTGMPNFQPNQSRASAAALSTVLRPTTLSYGNMRFSAIRPAEIPQPIKMKFCMIDYVGELTRCAKNGCNRLAGYGPTHR